MNGTSDIDQVKKVYRINLEGFFDPEKTSLAVDAMAEKFKNFPASEWAIVIDCRKLSTFKPEILPILERCYKEIYEKFGKAILINPEASIAKSQLHRIARQTEFTGVFVDTETEMVNILEG